MCISLMKIAQRVEYQHTKAAPGRILHLQLIWKTLLLMKIFQLPYQKMSTM